MSSIAGDSSLDHLLLGCSDLQSGIAFVEQRTGVRAAYGGVHPGCGTRNAVLSLGDRRYLEIIAPDPQQPGVLPWLTSSLPHIATLTQPRLIGWAVRHPDIDVLTAKLREAGMGVHGPHIRSRTRADGRVLAWKMATLADDRGGILPFFLTWDAASPHPADGAPAGCSLERFVVTYPNTNELARLFELFAPDVEIRRGDASRLDASLAGPKGRLETWNEGPAVESS